MLDIVYISMYLRMRIWTLYVGGDIFVNANIMKRLDEMETLFRALGDSTRLRILGLLLTGEICVCDIHESLKIPQSKASRHLAYLRRSGLVDTRRAGLWIHYRLARVSDPVLAVLTEAVQHALTHVDVVKKDTERLQSRTGCCVPTPADIAGIACCASEPVPVPVVKGAVMRKRF
jgi:ArsR family transcriptional regulator, arsenate/arsenite/antimonite-responsive transcriptional repressor